MYNLSHLTQKPHPIFPYQPAPQPPLPAIAHCGAWHPITAVPVRCGTCGVVVLGEGKQ